MVAEPVADNEELIETIDIHDLRQLRWPIMRVLFPHFVEDIELGRYLKGLLKSGRWKAVRVVPHSAADRASHHVLDVYGLRLDS